jgi:hypothetical protein
MWCARRADRSRRSRLRERLVSCGTEVSIDLPQVDDVCAEVLDHVAVVRADAGIECRKARTGKRERVLTGAAGQAIAVPGTSNQHVIAGATDEGVEVAAPLEREGDRAGGECRGINGIGAAPCH